MQILYPRKRFDCSMNQISAMSLLNIWARNEKEHAQKLSALWSPYRITLPTFSVRSALDLYLQAMQFSEGSVVIASAISIRDMQIIKEVHGLKVKTIDVHKDTLAPDVDELEHVLKTNRGKVAFVIHAHLFGAQSRLKETIQLTQKYQVPFIEDCAQLYDGGDYQGHPESDLCFWSFGPLKTATAFAGGIVTTHPRQAQTLKKMTALQQAYTPLSRLAYAKRINKYATLHIFSMPVIFTILVALLKTLNIDYDTFISKSTRSFRADELLEQIRLRPHAGLLAAMYYRQAHYTPSQIAARTLVGAVLQAFLPPEAQVGQGAMRHTYWLNACYAKDSEAFISHLRTNKIDASSISTSLSVLKHPRQHLDAKSTSQILPNIVYIPHYPDMSKSEKYRIQQVVSKYFAVKTNTHVPAEASNYTRIQPEVARSIVAPSKLSEVLQLMKEAHRNNHKITVVAQGYSHGGHTTGASNVILSTKNYNAIISYDDSVHTVTVESGITTEDLQKFLVAKGCSMLVNQSTLGFSVGGAVTSNIHGRSLKNSSFIDSVVAMTVTRAGEKPFTVTPNDKEFTSIIGGYGTGYFIATVTLQTAANTLFTQHSDITNIQRLADYVQEHSTAERETYFWARLLPNTDWSYTDVRVMTWQDTKKPASSTIVFQNPSIVSTIKNRISLTLTYHLAPYSAALLYRLEHKLGKSMNGQEFSRAELATPPVVDSSFLPINHNKWFNHVQEFFVPTNKLETFLHFLTLKQRTSKVHVSTTTLRFVHASQTSKLSQTPHSNCYGVMLYIHTHRDTQHIEEARHFIQDVCDQTIELGGTPYLTYAWALNSSQISRAYPAIKDHCSVGTDQSPICSTFSQRIDNELLNIN